MLTLFGNSAGPRFCDGLSRRAFLQIGGMAMGGLSLPQILAAEKAAPKPAKSGGLGHKAVIMVYLPGGPTHHDTFDLKTTAPSDIRSSFKPIRTKVPGIHICELLPKLAKAMDKLVVIRSLVGLKNRHESFQCYSGRPGGKPDDKEPAGGWPTLGAVVSRLQGPGPNDMPAYIDAGPQMRHKPYNVAGYHDPPGPISWPGFTGQRYTPFRLYGNGKSDLTLNSITVKRLDDRKGLLAGLDDFRRSADARSEADADPFREQAFSILNSSRLARALDLKNENPKTIARYGKSKPTTESFGGAAKNPQQLLLARRLVEAGARCVTVAFGAWDWHANRGGTLKQLAEWDLPDFDHALATLVTDLHERGLDKDVTVVVWGEFGRTPKINEKGGRDHWPNVAPAILAGGGMRTGQVIGSTTKDGGEANDRPVHVQEVFATLYNNLGINLDTATVTDLQGRPHYLVDPNYKPLPELS
jgi:hypothetical protein